MPVLWALVMMTRQLDADDACPARDGFFMPAEWAPHARTWMQWPTRVQPFGGPDGLLRARQAYAVIARTIRRFEPVTMVVSPHDAAEAQLACGPLVDLAEFPIDDAWARDSGPSFVVNGKGGVAGVHWRFNAWGNKYHPHANDSAIGATIIDLADLPIYRAPMVMEGGAIHVDGAGTLITTEQCLLNENRNPELSRQQIEARLALYLGILKIIWLGDGLKHDETDGHVDNVACFARPGAVLINMPLDKSDENYPAMADNLARLAHASDAQGRKLEIIELPQPKKVRRRHDGTRLETTYINFYACNGAIIAPAFDDPMDERARRILADAFPGREIVQVDALPVLEGGGGIHCITQQQPL